MAKKMKSVICPACGGGLAISPPTLYAALRRHDVPVRYPAISAAAAQTATQRNTARSPS